MHWYQIDVGNWPQSSLVQEGEIGSPGVYDYFFPAIAADDNGNVAIVFNRSGPSSFAGVYFSTRRATDPPGEMSEPVELKAGASTYSDGTLSNKWGDYSGITVGPHQDIWMMNQYATHSTFKPVAEWVGGVTFGELPPLPAPTPEPPPQIACSQAAASSSSVACLGDADCDFVVSVADVVQLLRFSATDTEAPPCFEAADADCSGIVDVRDAFVVLRAIIGLPVIVGPPCGKVGEPRILRVATVAQAGVTDAR